VAAVDPSLLDRLAQTPDLLVAASGLPAASGPARVEQLRRNWPADLVAAALTQADLRARAGAKFGDAARWMFFTPDGLEQSSRAPVAAHRAARFAAALPSEGPGPILDLCCGIGGDLLALARAASGSAPGSATGSALGSGSGGRAIVGVDRDPATARIAELNLAAAGATAQVLCADVTDLDLGGAAAAFIDPARRSSGRRTFDPSAYSPSLSFVSAVAAAVPLCAAKVAPGIPHDALPDGVEAEWVSWRGELKEAALWFGPFAGTARRATLLPSGATLTDEDLPPGAVPGSGALIGGIGAALYEPDPAVIRSGLVAAMAAGLPGGRLLDPHIAYIAADLIVPSPFGACFVVEDVLPYSVRRLKQALRARQVGTVEIKVRGLGIDPAVLRKELQPRGDASCTVLLARLDTGPIAILAQRAGFTA
jgi:hypothetical protein